MRRLVVARVFVGRHTSSVVPRTAATPKSLKPSKLEKMALVMCGGAQSEEYADKFEAAETLQCLSEVLRNGQKPAVPAESAAIASQERGPAEASRVASVKKRVDRKASVAATEMLAKATERIDPDTPRIKAMMPIHFSDTQVSLVTSGVDRIAEEVRVALPQWLLKPELRYVPLLPGDEARELLVYFKSLRGDESPTNGVVDADAIRDYLYHASPAVRTDVLAKETRDARLAEEPGKEFIFQLYTENINTTQAISWLTNRYQLKANAIKRLSRTVGKEASGVALLSVDSHVVTREMLNAVSFMRTAGGSMRVCNVSQVSSDAVAEYRRCVQLQQDSVFIIRNIAGTTKDLDVQLRQLQSSPFLNYWIPSRPSSLNGIRVMKQLAAGNYRGAFMLLFYDGEHTLWEAAKFIKNPNRREIAALESVLNVRHLRQALKVLQETRDYRAAFGSLPITEIRMLVQNTARSVSNAHLSQRIRKHGAKVTVGDLVAPAEERAKFHIPPDAVRRITNEEEAAQYSLNDVVMPSFQFPTKEFVIETMGSERADEYFKLLGTLRLEEFVFDTNGVLQQWCEPNQVSYSSLVKQLPSSFEYRVFGDKVAAARHDSVAIAPTARVDNDPTTSDWSRIGRRIDQHLETLKEDGAEGGSGLYMDYQNESHAVQHISSLKEASRSLNVAIRLMGVDFPLTTALREAFVLEGAAQNLNLTHAIHKGTCRTDADFKFNWASKYCMFCNARDHWKSSDCAVQNHRFARKREKAAAEQLQSSSGSSNSERCDVVLQKQGEESSWGLILKRTTGEVVSAVDHSPFADWLGAKYKLSSKGDFRRFFLRHRVHVAAKKSLPALTDGSGDGTPKTVLQMQVNLNIRKVS